MSSPRRTRAPSPPPSSFHPARASVSRASSSSSSSSNRRGFVYAFSFERYIPIDVSLLRESRVVKAFISHDTSQTSHNAGLSPVNVFIGQADVGAAELAGRSRAVAHTSTTTTTTMAAMATTMARATTAVNAPRRVARRSNRASARGGREVRRETNARWGRVGGRTAMATTRRARGREEGSRTPDGDGGRARANVRRRCRRRAMGARAKARREEGRGERRERFELSAVGRFEPARANGGVCVGMRAR